MTDRLAIALAQLNPTVGGVEANADRILKAREEAARLGADLMLGSELVVSGYPPEDLVLKPAFVNAAMAAVERLAKATSDGGPALIVGSPWGDQGKVMNAALLLEGGRIASIRYKHDLPNYGVFDEKRLFASGPLPGPMPFKGVRLGVMVCEDMWTPDAAECLQESGAELLLVPNGSPFEFEKHDIRIQLALARVTETRLPLAYVNQVGGQDELVFDGASFVVNPDHSLAAQLPNFRETVALTRWRRSGEGWVCEQGPLDKPAEGLEAIYAAMMLGLRDYVGKNRFPGVLLGLSGGIDSALVLALAVDALGAERVHAVMMPSRYTSQMSLDDAALQARTLGVGYDVISIEGMFEAALGALKPVFAGREPDTTEENIQARCRGLMLMAISNKTGRMVLTTGNKSEMAVGYATLYGDMAGGFAPIKDCSKLLVYRLAHYRNSITKAIPPRVIERAPSAELRHEQKDSDSLPPYDVLDPILELFIEDNLSVDEISARGFDRATVGRVLEMVKRNEYKRRQAPPGVRISDRAFGRDWRYPITSGYRTR
jgi:NAD+ synthase